VPQTVEIARMATRKRRIYMLERYIIAHGKSYPRTGENYRVMESVNAKARILIETLRDLE